MIGYSLPTAIEIDGKSYPITQKGHFEMVIDCFSVLNDKEIPEKLRVVDCCKIFYEDINDDSDIMLFGEHYEEAVDKMYSFFNCNQLEVGAKTNIKLIDWETDAQLICAAVNNVAQTEIRSEPYLHWFTFMGYYISVGDSPLATVVGLRDKKARGKKLEKHEREFIMNNPQYFTTKEQLEQQKQDEEWLDSVWDKG